MPAGGGTVPLRVVAGLSSGQFPRATLDVLQLYLESYSSGVTDSAELRSGSGGGPARCVEDLLVVPLDVAVVHGGLAGLRFNDWLSDEIEHQPRCCLTVPGEPLGYCDRMVGG
jgi:hypothetical protein